MEEGFICVYFLCTSALAVCSEAYFSAVAKMGDQALHTLSSRSLGKCVCQSFPKIGSVVQWFSLDACPPPQESKNMNVWANVKNYELLSFFSSTHDPEKDKDVDELHLLGPND